MTDFSLYKSDDPIAWCPGCGNFGILDAWKQALAEMDIKPENLLMVSGIGQAAKLPHYLKCNTFNGLHGRALPVATGAKIANHDLIVVAEGGDGDGYAEGGNHFLHAIRRNIDITYLIHNNQIYGLTKGQASPTTDCDMKTGTTPKGSYVTPEKPLSVAVAQLCGFVARGFVGEKDHLVNLMKKAIQHKGFSFLEILQNCVSFNKVNTLKWYQKRVYKLEDEGYDPSDRMAAIQKGWEWGDRIPIGLFFQSEPPSYEVRRGLDKKKPLRSLSPDLSKIEKIFEEFK
jgi:2-oxoglutarate/2-oxoacid ferredoxin oxidoreductase subunit beta